MRPAHQRGPLGRRPARWGRLWILGVLAVAQLTGCTSDTAPDPTPTVSGETLTVSSPSFEEQAAIPRRFTCDGSGVSPALTWEGVPADAVALALVVDDPDAPSGTFTHWVVLDIPADVTSVAAAAVPREGVQALNSSGDVGYFGPCPPSGKHHYRFTVYALSSATGLDPGAPLQEALAAVSSRTVAWGRLTGTYRRA